MITETSLLFRSERDQEAHFHDLKSRPKEISLKTYSTIASWIFSMKNLSKYLIVAATLVPLN